ncbi:MAG TPA: hypothetical protein VMS99_01410 [Acidimicrobiia bacterium]|nr:hypothetical protein [Acidimicrobiia bacterium]
MEYLLIDAHETPLMRSLARSYARDSMRGEHGVSYGIVSQQNAHNPGGRDWRPLMDRAIDLFLDHVGAI